MPNVDRDVRKMRLKFASDNIKLTKGDEILQCLLPIEHPRPLENKEKRNYPSPGLTLMHNPFALEKEEPRKKRRKIKN